MSVPFTSSSPAGKIRVGIIGVGNWAQYGHLPVLKLLPGYEVAAISSRSQERADALAAQHGISHAFSDFNELIRHPEVDLVVVTTTAPQHAEAVRAAAAAGKNVYSEWPLTTTLEGSRDLLATVENAGVRHVIGLQRRLSPSNRFLRDLLAGGYLGEIRSVRFHVSVEYFKARRPASLYFTVPEENFSSLLAIYGGHFLDALFELTGPLESLSGLTVNQFKEVTLIETGEVMPHHTADQVVVSGSFPNGAVFSAHLEAGKANNYGLQIDLTGTRGDLRISNAKSFGNAEDNVIEGAQGEDQPLQVLPIPSGYLHLPPSDLDASVLDLAEVYAAFVKDLREGTRTAPDFADALKIHAILDLIAESSTSGRRVAVPG